MKIFGGNKIFNFLFIIKLDLHISLGLGYCFWDNFKLYFEICLFKRILKLGAFL
jgi:hypothetical protein